MRYRRRRSRQDARDDGHPFRTAVRSDAACAWQLVRLRGLDDLETGAALLPLGCRPGGEELLVLGSLGFGERTAAALAE